MILLTMSLFNVLHPPSILIRTKPHLGTGKGLFIKVNKIEMNKLKV